MPVEPSRLTEEYERDLKQDFKSGGKKRLTFWNSSSACRWKPEWSSMNSTKMPPQNRMMCYLTCSGVFTHGHVKWLGKCWRSSKRASQMALIPGGAPYTRLQ